MDLLFKMGDVQVAFGILIHYFMQWPSYLLQCTPPSFIFTFDLSLLQVFGCLLSPRSFNNPKRPLAHKQVFFPMTFGGIKLIPMTTITPTTYLGNWAFIASIIVVRFMVDQHPFLLETLTQVDNNTFLFQQHFKATCDFLPPPTRACFFKI